MRWQFWWGAVHSSLICTRLCQENSLHGLFAGTCGKVMANRSNCCFFLMYQYACVFVFQCISPKHAAKQYLPPGSGKHVMKIQHCNQESAMFSKCHQRTMVARSGGLVYTKKGPHWKQPERAQKMKVTND